MRSRGKRTVARGQRSEIRGPNGQMDTVSLSSLDGANPSTLRGWIYFPTLDTRREIDSYSRLEVLKKARWFCRNSGLCRRIVQGVANMVGYMSPKALTSDAEWNELAERNFENRAGSAQVCDLSGKNNFYSMQIALTRSRLRDGDLLVALTKTESGGAAMMPYESHQIGNQRTEVRGQTLDWIDGVRLNGFGRHLFYRLLNGAGYVDVSARDAIYYADTECLGQVRGVTALAHAVNHLVDVTEIVRDTKLGIKISNQMGFYLSRPGPQTKPLAMGAGRNREQPDAERVDKVDLETVFRAGKVADLGSGAELKTLQDARPHPNQMSLVDYLIRDISWGVGLSPEVLWFVGRINGASNRYVLADAGKWIDQEQQRLVDLFCTRYWAYHVACELSTGRLRRCEDPEWWRVGWIPQERITVDRGRDGKLHIDQHRAGMLTLSRHYNELGLDWKAEVDQWVSERVYLREQAAAHGMTLSELMPPAPGAAGGGQMSEDRDQRSEEEGRQTSEDDEAERLK